jgi:hypothetical protein
MDRLTEFGAQEWLRAARQIADILHPEPEQDSNKWAMEWYCNGCTDDRWLTIELQCRVNQLEEQLDHYKWAASQVSSPVWD